MKRRTFDVVASTVGLLLAAVLIVAGGLLTWAHGFVQHEVHNQLASQKIYFPSAGDPQLDSPAFSALRQYAGMQLTTGDQAEAYADHYIANHLAKIGGGQTYSQLSAKSNADPTDTQLAAQVQTMFRGETLRGLLLNAYAFGKMGTIAGVAAVVSFASGGAVLLLSGLGFWHAARVRPDRELLARRRDGEPHQPVTV